MNIAELLKDAQNVEPEMIEVSLAFWMKDHDEFRTPFPEYVQPHVAPSAVKKFANWAANLNPEARKEVNDEILLERFEEILFEEAVTLVNTEEEKLTLLYPFMLRPGDKVDDEVNGTAYVGSRKIAKEGDFSFMEVVLTDKDGKELRQTRFELPV